MRRSPTAAIRFREDDRAGRRGAGARRCGTLIDVRVQVGVRALVAVACVRPGGGVRPAGIARRRLPAQGRRGARPQGRVLPRRRRLAGQARRLRHLPAAHLLRRRSRLRAAGAAAAARGAHPAVMPTSTGKQREMERVGYLEFMLQRHPAEADRVCRGRRRSVAPVRAVQRPDQRHRDLPGRALHGHRPAVERRLRRRLQPRLPPLLLLQRRVRLPVPAVREPAEDADPRRRAAAGVRRPWRRRR